MTPPWHALERASLNTCEPDLGGWISHPAETASALAYLIVAGILWKRYRSRDQMLPIRFLPAIISSIGITSLLFHSSFRATFQRLDLGVIPLLTSYLLATALVHRKHIARSQLQPLTALFAAFGAAAPQLHVSLGFAFVASQGLAVLWLWQGILTAETQQNARRARWLLLSGAVLLTFDHAGIGCLGNGMEHFLQPHVVWHLLSAASIYFLYHTERQLELRWREQPTHFDD
ncbi:MAG: hypothetical protein VX453_07300 [Acidobacteriota bacterium]|nr:hypothetical protein [Acidobacteriota bacterium]